MIQVADALPLDPGYIAFGSRANEPRVAERLHFRCPDGLGVELNPVDPARIWGLA